MKRITYIILLFLSFNFSHSQTTLTAGDIIITGIISDNTVEDEFSFVLLKDIAATTVISFTSIGWSNSLARFISGNGNGGAEGVLTWTAPAGGLSCGTEVVIIANIPINATLYFATTGTVLETDTGFGFAPNQDQILAYQGAFASPTFLAALHFGTATWSDPNPITVPADRVRKSNIPTGLTNGIDAHYLGDFDNGYYSHIIKSGAPLISAIAARTASYWENLNNGNPGYTLSSRSYTCCPTTTTWTSSGWDNGTPTTSITAVIDFNYDTTSGSFSACSLMVNSGFTLTVSDTDYVEVENDVVVDGNIIVQPQGAFIQNDDNHIYLNANGTSIVNKLTAPMDNWYEYTYWSSPVSGETIGNGLFESQYNRRFSFNASQFNDELAETGNNNILVAGQDNVDDEGNDWTWVDPSTNMQPGVGYASTHAEATFAGPGSPPYQFSYTFEGPFNNGVINVPVNRNDISIVDFNWNLIGNPYPSAISANAFITQNMYDATTNPTGILEGSIAFWSQNTDKASNANGNEAFNFATSDYAYYNGVSGTLGGDGLTPNGSIPSGQAFFVSFSDSAPSNSETVIFNNSMRSLSLSPDNSQFFKGAKTKKKTSNTNSNKIWVNLTSDNGVFNQILIGYVDGATNNDDGSFYDTHKIVAPKTYAALYSRIVNSDKKYVIQGKAINSINENEIIQLGFSTKINVATLFTLSIAQFEGAFLTNNTVYIKDNLLNTLHNLSVSDYTFTSEVGVFNDRFEIVFNANALSTKNISDSSNTLKIIELEDNHVQFTASKVIKSVRIFDLLGRQLYNLKGQRNSETYKLSNLSSSIYIAKVELSNGTTITKKAFKK